MALLPAMLLGFALSVVVLAVVGVALHRHATFQKFMDEQCGRGKTLWTRASNNSTESVGPVSMGVDLVDHRIRADACTIDLEENNLSSSCVLTQFRRDSEL